MFHIEKQQQYVNDTNDDAVSADINLLYPHNMWYHFPLAGIPKKGFEFSSETILRAYIN